MRAIIQNKYGGPEVLALEEMKKPEINPGQVLVKVIASTVNRTDSAILRAKPFIMRLGHGFQKPRLSVPGTDFAGVIEETGEEVTSYKKGDRVFGFNDTGVSSKAEYLVIDQAGNFSLIPKEYSFKQAAATLEGVHYACNFINKVKLKPGEKVLVNGATGAIGSALVQLLKYYKAEVTAVGDTNNLDLMKRIGADDVIDYTKEDFTLTKDRFDYVFDAVGKSTFSKCRPLLNPKGIYISSELGPYLQNPFLSLLTPLFRGKKVRFPFPANVKRSISIIKKLIEQGRYEPVIDRSYSLEEIAEAYTYVETGQKTGNVVILTEEVE